MAGKQIDFAGLFGSGTSGAATQGDLRKKINSSSAAVLGSKATGVLGGSKSGASLGSRASGVLGNTQKGSGSLRADQIGTEAVVLATLLLDDSGSMDPYKGLLASSVEKCIDVLKKTHTISSEIWVSVEGLNSGMIQPYRRVQEVGQINFRIDGGTPLIRRANEVLRSILSQKYALESDGVIVRSASLFFSDGEDTCGPQEQLLKELQGRVREIQSFGEKHILSGIAFGGYGVKHFQDAGFMSSEISSPQTATEFAESFNNFSQATGALSRRRK